MLDLSKTIEAKSDQLNADDLIGGARTIKVTDVKKTESETQPVFIYYEGDQGKPYKPNLGMRRVLIQLWGTNGNDYIGRSITLFREGSVKYAGSEVGGIQISHVSHIDKPERVLLTVSRGKKRPMTINPIIIEKETLSDERFQKALVALEQGKSTVEKLMEYDLTEEQLKQLNK